MKQTILTWLRAGAAFARAAPRPVAELASRARIELPVGQNPLKDLVPLAFTANTLPLIPSGSAPRRPPPALPADDVLPSPARTAVIPDFPYSRPDHPSISVHTHTKFVTVYFRITP